MLGSVISKNSGATGMGG